MSFPEIQNCANCKEVEKRDSDAQLIPSLMTPGQWQVRCTWCDAATLSWETRGDAIEVWNDIYGVTATEESKNK